MFDIILASQSPRRAEILSALNLPFHVVPSHFDEDSVPYDNHPGKYVCQLAESKAKSIAANHPDSVVIAADTVVFLDHVPYGKPPTREDAVRYLTELCGKWHSVYTGVSVIKGNMHRQAAEETRVLFNPLSQDQINAYLNAIQWQDKSGAYAIQGNGGSLLVSKIDGCFYNVMGLPVSVLQTLLLHFGIDLWNYFDRH